MVLLICVISLFCRFIIVLHAVLLIFSVYSFIFSINLMSLLHRTAFICT